jgi:hypothetical protein
LAPGIRDRPIAGFGDLEEAVELRYARVPEHDVLIQRPADRHALAQRARRIDA